MRPLGSGSVLLLAMVALSSACPPGNSSSSSSSGSSCTQGSKDCGCRSDNTCDGTLVCQSGTCRPSTCVNGVKDGLETDVDCGGNPLCDACAPGKMCNTGSDCWGYPTYNCYDGACHRDPDMY